MSVVLRRVSCDDKAIHKSSISMHTSLRLMLQLSQAINKLCSDLSELCRREMYSGVNFHVATCESLWGVSVFIHVSILTLLQAFTVIYSTVAVFNSLS